MVLDSDITAHFAIDGQFAVHEQELILIGIVRSLTMVGSIDPTHGIVVDIFVFAALPAGVITTTGDIYSCTAIGTITDIEFVLLVFEFDVEIIAARNRCIVMIAVTGKTGNGCGIQVHRPNGSVLRVA